MRSITRITDTASLKSSTLDKLKIKIILLKRKNIAQLFRLVFTKIPVFSLLGYFFYRVIFHSRHYEYINRKAKSAFNTNLPTLSLLQKNALSKIKQDGIFVLDIKDIFDREILLNSLIEESDALLNGKVSAAISKNDIRPPKIRGLGRNINGQYLPPSFVDFFLSDTILDVVNSYFGKFARLNYVDAWCNIPANQDDYIYSTEKWHRDHEDINIIKVFLYLLDVEDTMGCFSYLRGTQNGGKFGHINPVNPPKGVLPSNEEINRIIANDAAALQVCKGNRGTIIIADTSGFHRGGRPTNQLRKVLVGFYTTDAGVDQHRYRLPDNINPDSLSPSARYALHLEDK